VHAKHGNSTKSRGGKQWEGQSGLCVEKNRGGECFNAGAPKSNEQARRAEKRGDQPNPGKAARASSKTGLRQGKKKKKRGLAKRGVSQNQRKVAK